MVYVSSKSAVCERSVCWEQECMSRECLREKCRENQKQEKGSSPVKKGQEIHFQKSEILTNKSPCRQVRSRKYGYGRICMRAWGCLWVCTRVFGEGQECVVWVFTLVGGDPIVHSSFRPNAAVFPIPRYSCVWRTSRARAQFGSLPL